MPLRKRPGWPVACAGALFSGIVGKIAFARDTPFAQQISSFGDRAHAVIQGKRATLRHEGKTDATSLLSSPEGDPNDPALSIGTLPNGMRYYIRVNKSPAKRVELRLTVNAGSLQEDDDRRGYAHFLEHMAFNGTTNFPANKLIDFVEKSGMDFGADLNAYTNFDETVYMLTLPTDDPSILKNGLQIF